ncbi:Na /alanine symporter,amino acid carrier protein,Sodium:alanine symporter family [Chlamydia serpentis]|uniref:Na /alanine symporter,amino acid carrier protein,Sodium:alanine symporter family n=1 Tax=Chlamydia serpentis TaxID=1967782 RepID=A0A2R8FB55_9CHLA|nr:amino acid carrier protein [Chlamydia serpentis]SPN73655.1 Na /alanine symporter,amino acid carrier protein,Sodium:alanine symporter family [Chlamydia serpentis]
MKSPMLFLSFFDDFFWSYVAFILIIVLGVSFSWKSRLAQFTKFSQFCRLFHYYSQNSKKNETKQGVHPLKVFFASAGGNIGIGNVVGIVTAACIGGPGALFWVWIAGIFGSIVKYSEVYLGIKFRTLDSDGVYQGGPMYFLTRAFKTRAISVIVAILLCIYGVEIYQFSVITDSLAHCWNIPKIYPMLGLLFLIFYAVQGGLQRVGKICSIILPFFMLLYCSLALYILFKEFHTLPHLLATVFSSAFKGQSALGGFAGCTVATTIHQGISRAAYSGDIGIGFDSIIQSESSAKDPSTQAQLSIVGIAIDNLICTLSLLMVLASGSWSLGLENASQTVEHTLNSYFPMVKFFLPTFFFVTGYTTIISYFLVGKKCAKFLYGKPGAQIYTLYGFLILPLFCFLSQNTALLIMSVSGALLLCFNLLGVFLLRKEVEFPKKPPFLKDTSFSMD